MAAPTLRKSPLDFDHLVSCELMLGDAEGLLVEEQTDFVLHTLQLARQIILSDFFRFKFRTLPNILLPSGIELFFSDSTSRYATSASYDLNEDKNLP